MSNCQDDVKSINESLVKKCIDRYSERIKVLDNHPDFVCDNFVRDKPINPIIMYKLRCDDGNLYLEGKDGRKYVFLVEFDPDDFAYGIYFGCRCTLKANEEIATQVEACNKEWRNIHREVIGALNHTFVDLDFFKRVIPTDNVSDMTYWPFWFRLGEEESVEDVAAVATKVIRNVYQWFLRSENYDTEKEEDVETNKKPGPKKNTEVRTRYTLKAYKGVLKQFDEKTKSGQRVYKDDAARYFTTFLEILEDKKIIAPYRLYEKCWDIKYWENFEFAYLIQKFFEVSEIKVVRPDRIPWSLFTPIILSSEHNDIDEIRKVKYGGSTNRVDGKIKDILDELMRRMKAEK